MKHLAWALMLIPLVAAPARAQEQAAKDFYASIERGIRAEVRALFMEIDRKEIWPSLSAEDDTRKQERVARAKNAVRIYGYNKAVLMSLCAAEAARAHSPDTDAVPPKNNLMLRTCIEAKLELLRKSANTWSYVAQFFPERLDPCEQKARLPDLERQFVPYAFLELDEPKLYDYELYNRCLMSAP